MRIGDIEYTQRGILTNTVGNASEFFTLAFAVGLKIRPLITRISVFPLGASAVTGGQGVWFENGNLEDAGQTLAAMRLNANLLPLWTQDNALATNGMGMVVPFENTYWKIAQPQVRFHGVSTVIAILDAVVVMHYRFAELTPDEVIEIAAQRGT